ncbi:uncharacterized protein LOC129879937 isoform X2 [Solanum dulcamara]|uniref:uncharacterized protein LOC129879937 isoform X2 n=1 Tax=Solanum dulcamara TaxID=45834 RepID=UPI0024854F40|nr:uncharacterized protein LOC129879937 isoform X2 [Solanum dulcamara]
MHSLRFHFIIGPKNYENKKNFSSICSWKSSFSSSEYVKFVSKNDSKRYNIAAMGVEKNVGCEVEVVSWRERKIKAEILVNADVDSVWNALTDYERLADFVPNLVSSRRIPCPRPGRIWLEQRGIQRSLYWHIEARVVLDLQEFINSDNVRELHFSMVDGDFKKFEGKWSVRVGTRSSTAILSYEVSVIPRFNFPAIFLERIIRSDLPVNLQALSCRAENSYQGDQSVSVTCADTKEEPGSYLISTKRDIDHVISLENKSSGEHLKDKFVKATFGPSTPATSDVSNSWGIFGKTCRLDKPCVVDEVHLRRFDGLLENGGVHRCVVASITVKAPVREVWNVLTAYESLPEIVPNLAISKILSRDNNKVRILQEGCKGLLYMVLHARVVLDLSEHIEQEISFEQVEGDFNSFQGKWILEQLGSHHTLLKYSVESKMHKNSFLSEAIMEEVIYEDLPSNLCAIRDYIEERETEKPLEKFNHDEFREEGFMPMRKQLRKHGRVDIEKAITRMGGFRRISSLMNLSLAYKHRKPKGYWDSLENLQEEISRFQKNWGMDPLYMPSRKSFERAGRYDIARALEKWGGLHEVSRLLSLKVRHPNRQASLAKEKKVELLANDVNNETTSSKPFVAQDAKKWLMKLKDLDINWVE